MITPPDTPARSEPAISQSIAFRMIVALNLIIKPFMETHGKEHDLSLSEWRCMMALASEPGSSGEDVSRIMGMDKMTVSRTLRRLEKSRRASRETDPRNRKRWQWSLTAEGWSLFDRIAPTAAEREERFLRAVDPAQQEALRLILDAAIRDMQDS